MTATPRRRVLKDGTEVWRLQYRLVPGGKPTADVFSTAEAAMEFSLLVDRIGGVAARAIREATTEGGPEVVTCAEAFEEYCSRAASYTEPGTVHKYRRNWERYIGPTFDQWPISHVTRKMIEDWVAGLRAIETIASRRARANDPEIPADTLSAKTIRNVQGLMSSVLKLQVERRRLSENVAAGVKLPKAYRKRQPVFMTDSQIAALIGAIPTDWRPFVELLLSTGLRWSEATALHPSDFNLEATPPTVRVQRAWKKVGGRVYSGAPKSPASNRTISFPASVARELTPSIEKVTDDGLVFIGPRGGRLDDAWFHERIWQPAVTQAKILPRPRIHDTRHTHASMLIARGVPLPYIQHRLGHEKITTTVGTYGHLIPDAGIVTADATELAMAQALPQLMA